MKGLKLEQEFSREFHREGVPLLVSAALLRSRDMGQIDLARLQKIQGEWVIEIGEVKSSIMGAEQMLRSQRSRLYATQGFLSAVFSRPSRLRNLTPQISV